MVGDARQVMAAYLKKNPVPFSMLIDEDRQVMKQFEVYNRLSWDAYRLAHPSAFLIDPQGQIRYSFVASNQWDWPRTDLLVGELAKLRAAEGVPLRISRISPKDPRRLTRRKAISLLVADLSLCYNVKQRACKIPHVLLFLCLISGDRYRGSASGDLPQCFYPGQGG